MRTEPLPADAFIFERTYVAFDDAHVQVMVGDPDQVFRYMSLTKPIAAWAILVAVSQGKLALDEPAGPQGSTFRHLLSHASGLPAEKGEPIAKPGRRRIYSNYGYDVLAAEVEKRIGGPIQDWIRATVLEPLGMDTVQIPGTIAYSAIGSADSLMRFGLEVLHPSLLPPELAEQAVTAQFPGIPGITPGYGSASDTPWALGLSVRNPNNPHWTGPSFSGHVVGHFGMSGSFLYVDLVARRAGLFLGAEDFSPEHVRIWPQLTEQMLLS